MKRLIIMGWCFLLCTGSAAQNDAFARVAPNFGLRANVFLGDKQYNHITLSIAIGTTLRHPDFQYGAIFLQTALNVYANGLGTNIFDTYTPADSLPTFRRKTELDLVTSLLLVGEAGQFIPERHRYLYPVKHFNQMTAYVNPIQRYWSLYYGTNFVFNSSHRNQQVGCFGINTAWVSLGYANDGAVGISSWTGDHYDRFWTGSGYARINAWGIRGVNDPTLERLSIEYHYDRFTYDVQDAYRISNQLMLPATLEKDQLKLFYNNAITTFKVNLAPFSAGLSIIGKSKIDIQDAIHRSMNYPKHFTFARKAHLLTLSYYPLPQP